MATVRFPISYWLKSFYRRIFDLVTGYYVAVDEKNIFAANANSLQNVRIWCNIALPNLDFSQCTLKYASLIWLFHAEDAFIWMFLRKTLLIRCI